MNRLPRPWILLAWILAALPTIHAQSQKTTPLTFAFEVWHLIDLNDDGLVDALLVGENHPGGRPLAVAWGQTDGSFLQSPTTNISAATSAMAFGQFGGGGMGVAAISPSSVQIWRAGSKAGKPLSLTLNGQVEIKHASLFRAPLRKVPHLWHWPLDIDGDQQDDLFLPVATGVAWFKGQKKGLSPQSKLLPLPGRRSVARDGRGAFMYQRDLPSPTMADIDGDGRSDLAWFDADGLHYYLQPKPGQFDLANPGLFALPWLASGTADGVIEQTDIGLEDLDGDGRADLVLSRMRSKAGEVSDMETTIVILLNRGGKDPFPRQPDTVIRTKGVVGIGPHARDIDGDGMTDLVIGTYGARLADAVSRFFGVVPVVLRLYRGRRGDSGPFDSAPSLEHKLKVAVADFDRWSGRNAAHFQHDFDGDKIVDLVVMRRQGKKHVFELFPGRGKGGGYKLASKATRSISLLQFEGFGARRFGQDGVARLITVGKRSLTTIDFSK
ncbi:MAG: VCBS repeat-containing protein [Planctomycetota bacterium]